MPEKETNEETSAQNKTKAEAEHNTEVIGTLENAVEDFQDSADKVKDGINNVLEPEIKDARISSYDTMRVVKILSRRITIMFGALIVINLVILALIATRM